MMKNILTMLGLAAMSCLGNVDLGGGAQDSTAGGAPAMGGGSNLGGTASIPERGPALEASAYDCSDAAKRCAESVPGNAIAYSNEAEFISLVSGAWLHCAGTAYPAQFGVGVYISPDHTWNALTLSSDGQCVPVTAGFDGYGTWSLTDTTSKRQFNLHSVGNHGALFFPLFSDTDQMRLEFSPSNDYVRAAAL